MFPHKLLKPARTVVSGKGKGRAPRTLIVKDAPPLALDRNLLIGERPPQSSDHTSYTKRKIVG